MTITHFNPEKNYELTRQIVGYVERRHATKEIYENLGFKCGLEIHQQLKTKEKLFCRCPAGLYQQADDFDAELIRHMRPTLSELGEYDGTALMEFRTRKTVLYRIKNETACTYDIDDTPPFPLNREALGIAVEIALMLRMNVVGELHITRKQYLDGSIPTGFQRTGIVAIEGSFPLRNKTVRIIQLSIEEDSCREVSDIGHQRVYTTDRLGTPLIETVTYPDMITPDEAAEAAQFLRFVARSSGHVRTGIGAAREDVNVSVAGGTRVEIKGVAHIRWIPALTHNEAFRQHALLLIRDEIRRRNVSAETWTVSHREIDYDHIPMDQPLFREAKARRLHLELVNLPQFRGVLSFFTQPGQSFADELSGRLKVIACIEHPNMTHSESLEPIINELRWSEFRRLLGAQENDAQVLVIGPSDDIATAIDVIQERCRLAVLGVPNETRKGLADGTNIFERVLPGPDRMYPDTDSAPISIDDEMIEERRKQLPINVAERMDLLLKWRVPADTFPYLLKRNLVTLLQRIVADCSQDPIFVSTLLAQSLKHVEGQTGHQDGFTYDKVYDLFAFGKSRGLKDEILKTMVPVMYAHPHMDFESILTTLDFQRYTMDQVLGYVPALRRKFAEIRTTPDPQAEGRWIMGNLRRRAIGNVCMKELSERLVKESGHD